MKQYFERLSSKMITFGLFLKRKMVFAKRLWKIQAVFLFYPVQYP